MLIQEQLFETLTPQPSSAVDARSGSFIDNMKLPIHRWFRYSAGFSAGWAEEVIRNQKATRVLDPFAGSGTSLLAADACGVSSVGIEAHPFVARIGAAKQQWRGNVIELKNAAAKLLKVAMSEKVHLTIDSAPALLAKCYDGQALTELYSLRTAFLSVAPKLSERTRALIFLAITAILRECSFVGTAQWQYVLPNKRKAKVTSPYQAFDKRITMFCDDIESFEASGGTELSALVQGDAREIDKNVVGDFDLLLTSPPYPNNYDYADATRLEMTFWGEVASWGDLHDAVRQFLVRSSSQHTAKEKLNLDTLLQVKQVAPILAELKAVCEDLSAIRETKGGKKTYHTMVAAYFADMALVLNSARKVMRKGATMCFVIGDSAPYGIYVPADKWFAVLAESAGFKGSRFEKIRDRNTKWKNRKHTVPLNEGRLWIDC